MSVRILHEEEGYRITQRDEGSDYLPDWDYRGFATLADALIADDEARPLFLELYSRETPPLLLTDPNAPFGPQVPLPQSGFFDPETIVIFREDDSVPKVRFRELAKELIAREFLRRDRLTVIRCGNEDCKSVSIGSGDTSGREGFYCTRCGDPAYKKKSRNVRVVGVYSFTPELRDLLIKGRGRILEGIIYRSLRSDPDIVGRFDVVPYPQLVMKRVGENGQPFEESKERDIVLIDKIKRVSPIVVLASISASQDDERRQVRECKELGLTTVFVSARGISERSQIMENCSRVFANVSTDKEFPKSLIEYIREFAERNK